MNKNFNSIHLAESKLAHAQNSLSTNFLELQDHEKLLLRKEIFLELRTLKESTLNSFIFELQQILTTNHLDKSYDIVFSLLRNSEFCYQSLCYSLPIFSSLDKTLVSVTVQSTQQSLAKGFYISCTILPNQRTSVYSHKMAILENDKLHFKQEGLSSITFSELKHPNIDQLTRPINAEDKLVNRFYPIYNANKVSLQCLSPVSIIVDNQTIWCDDKTLQFIDFPHEIIIAGETILSVHVPQHFSMKMAEMTHDFEVLSKFQPLNSTTPHLVQEIVSYFEVAEPIHWSFFTLSVLLCVCLIIMICFCSYLKCPSIMLNFLKCCWTHPCCLIKTLTKRVDDREIVRARKTQVDTEEGVQMIELAVQNPQLPPNTENYTPQSNRPMITPTAPNLSTDSSFSVHPTLNRNPNIYHLNQPLASSADYRQPTYNSECNSGFQSCFCTITPPCKGPISAPPF